MTDRIRFDRERGDAWKTVIVDTVAEEAGKTPGLSKRVIALVSLIIAALLLSGGGVALALGFTVFPRAAAPAPTSLSPSPVPSETPTPTPTETPTPAAPAVPPMDPADPGTWVIGDGAVGPLRLSESIKDAEAKLPGLSHDDGEVCRSEMFGDAPQIYIIVPPGPQETDPVHLVYIAFRGDVDGPDAAIVAKSPKTEAGIGIGSSLQDVEAAYPGVQPQVYPRGDQPHYYGIEQTDGTWVTLDMNADGSAVKDIVVGREAGSPSEFCA
jgi:hypothetical protein